MNTLIVFMMLCGEPDSVLIREIGKAPIHISWKQITNSEENAERFLELMKDAERIKIDTKNGICV